MFTRVDGEFLELHSTIDDNGHQLANIKWENVLNYNFPIDEENEMQNLQDRWTEKQQNFWRF